MQATGTRCRVTSPALSGNFASFSFSADSRVYLSAGEPRIKPFLSDIAVANAELGLSADAQGKEFYFHIMETVTGSIRSSLSLILGVHFIRFYYKTCSLYPRFFYLNKERFNRDHRLPFTLTDCSNKPSSL